MMAATIQKLRDTMLSVEPKVRRLEYGTGLTIKYIPGFEEKYQELEKNGDFFASHVFAFENLPSPGDEVHPNLFIGGKHSIANTEWLKTAGITGIVNVAHGNDIDKYEPDYESLKELKITYKGFSLGDFISSDHDSTHESTMLEAVEAIHKLMISQESAKVMVTCAAGISRSSSTVLCYMIIKKDISAYDALKEIRQFRDVYPSKQQLMYVAKVHNKKFGFDDVEVVDVAMTMGKGRQEIMRRVGKPN